MVGIINYGLGNLGSIQNMLKVIGEKSLITDNIKELDKCDRYILPGVGAFDAGMSKLNESGLFEYIRRKHYQKGNPYWISVSVCNFSEGKARRENFPD